MKKLELTKIQSAIFCLVLVLVLCVGGIIIPVSKVSFDDGTAGQKTLAKMDGTAGQIAKMTSKKKGTAGQRT